MSLDIYPLDLQIFGNVDILSIITSYLPLKDILSILQTFRGAKRWANHIYIDMVHRMLSYYVKDPPEFRDIMRQNKCVVSGSAVLWLMDGFPSSWFPHDWEIFIPRGGTAPVVEYLLSQGFQRIDPIEEMGITDRLKKLWECHTISITRLERDGEGITVDIHESASASPIKPITYFHDTLTMNYISADGIVSYYPQTTFQHTGLIRDCTLVGPSKYANRIKYWSRGYSMYDYTTRSEEWVPFLCPKLHRFDHDDKCLVLSLKGPVPIHLFDTVAANNLHRKALSWRFSFGMGRHRSCRDCDTRLSQWFLLKKHARKCIHGCPRCLGE